MINVQHLNKIYHKHHALKNLTFNVKKGEIFGIVGMSGAGKSTLMRCLTRLEYPTSGTIVMPQNFGMIFQHFNLFTSRTALENVMFPLEIAKIPFHMRKKRALELLSLVSLADKQDCYPSTLSGGEKQRVAIARALANDPALLLSDEATSALDPKSTHTILNLLIELNKTLGLTICLITHQMEVIKQLCTKVAVMHQGEIVEMGDVADLFSSPKHSATLALLKSLSHDIPEHFYPKDTGKILLRLTFKGNSASEPLISRMIKQFDIEVNILLGGIDVLQTATIGNLVVEVSGTPSAISGARDFLEKKGVVCDELRP